MAKYGGTTRTRLDHLAHPGGLLRSGWGEFTELDIQRLQEVVLAAEGLDTYTNPVHAHQRLRKALKALREASK